MKNNRLKYFLILLLCISVMRPISTLAQFKKKTVMLNLQLDYSNRTYSWGYLMNNPSIEGNRVRETLFNPMINAQYFLEDNMSFTFGLGFYRERYKSEYRYTNGNKSVTDKITNGIPVSGGFNFYFPLIKKLQAFSSLNYDFMQSRMKYKEYDNSGTRQEYQSPIVSHVITLTGGMIWFPHKKIGLNIGIDVMRFNYKKTDREYDYVDGIDKTFVLSLNNVIYTFGVNYLIGD